MKADVETHYLVLLAHAQWDQGADDFKDDEGQCSRPHQRDEDPIKLSYDLLWIALEKTMHASRQLWSCRQRAHRKDTSEQGAGKSTDAVDAKHVERVVIADLELEPGTGPEAERAGDQPDQHRLHGQHKTGCRCNGP